MMPIPRLDVLSLKAAIHSTKRVYRRLDYYDRETQNQLRNAARVFWNRISTIIRREESGGNDAIRRIGILTYYGTQITPSFEAFDELLSVLEDYNLIQRDYNADWMDFVLIMHSQLLSEVIREKNEPFEMDFAEECLNLVAPPLYSDCLIFVWKYALEHTELASQFKDTGFYICQKSFLNYKGNKEETIVPKTRQYFMEMFGGKDVATIELSCLELKLLCRSGLQRTLDELPQKFRQYSPELEELVRTGEITDHLLTEIHSTITEILSFASARRMEELMFESLKFCTSMFHLFRGRGQLNSAAIWFKLIVEWQKDLIKIDQIRNLLHEFRASFLLRIPLFVVSYGKDGFEELGNLRYYTQTISQTVFDFSDSLSVGERNSFLEELLIILQEGCECVLTTMKTRCLQFDWIATEVFSELLSNSIICLSILGKFEQILNATEKIDTLFKTLLHVFNKFRICVMFEFNDFIALHVSFLLEIRSLVLKIATTAQNLEGNLKIDLLKKSMRFAKLYLFKSCVLAVRFPKDSIPKLRLHLIQCGIELNLFLELIQISEEYEKLLENCGFNPNTRACEMIEFYTLMMKKLKLVKCADCVSLIQSTQRSTRVDLEIISSEECTIAEDLKLKEMAAATLDLCQAHLDNLASLILQ